MDKRSSFVEEAQLVYKALECPLMFSLLPQLLPMQFLDMIHMEEQDVKALERDLEERPWVFGFKQVGNKAERERERWKDGQTDRTGKDALNFLYFEKFIKLNMHEIQCDEIVNIVRWFECK